MDISKIREIMYRYGILILLMLTMLIAPYYRGIFFRYNELYFNFVIALVLLATVGHVTWDYFRGNKEAVTRIDSGQRTGLASGVLPGQDPMVKKFSLPVYIVWLLPLAYLIAMLNAADIGLARDELFRNITIASVFTIVMFTVNTRWQQQIAFGTIILSSVWISLFGLLTIAGLVEFQDSVLGSRLSSVFQYPNTFAALVGATFLASLVMALKPRWNVVIGSIMSGLYIGLASLFMTTFILTGSRAAIVALALAYLIILLIVPLWDKLSYIIFTGIAAVPALIAANEISHNIRGLLDYAINWKLVVVLLVASVVMSFSYNLMIGLADKIGRKKLVSIILPIVVLLLVAMGYMLAIDTVNSLIVGATDEGATDFLGGFFKRIATILSSTEETSYNARVVFVKDSLKIFKDNILFGSGGGAWRTLFEQYQDYSYYSTEAHIYYFQLIVETGIFGFIMFLLIVLLFVLILLSIICYNRRQDSTEKSYLFIAAFAIFLMIMGHSAADFDMTYTWIAVLVFMSMAIVNSEINVNEGFRNYLRNSPLAFIVKSVKIPRHLHWLLLILIALVAIVINGFGIKAYQYERMADELLSQEAGVVLDDIYKASEFYYKAYSADKSNYGHTANYVSSLMDKAKYTPDNDKALYDIEAIRLLVGELEDQPRNTGLQQLLIDTYARGGYVVNALDELDVLAEKTPFTVSVHSQRISLAYQLAEHYIQEGMYDDAKELLEKTYAYYEEFEKLKEINSQRGPGNRSFNLNRRAYQNMGKSYYVTGSYENALHMFDMARKDKDLAKESLMWMAAIHLINDDGEKYKNLLKNDLLKNDYNAEEEIIMLSQFESLSISK